MRIKDEDLIPFPGIAFHQRMIKMMAAMISDNSNEYDHCHTFRNFLSDQFGADQNCINKEKDPKIRFEILFETGVAEWNYSVSFCSWISFLLSLHSFEISARAFLARAAEALIPFASNLADSAR